MVNIHQTRVSQFELSKSFPILKDVVRFDRALNAGGQLVRSFELVAPYVSEYHPDWFQDFARSEAKARAIRELHTGRISGLLQTEGYMRALFEAHNPDLAPEELDDLVRGRLARQQRLLRPDGPPRLIVLQEQATLERAVGGDGVMRGQLRHLLAVMRRPNVILQVLPYEEAARVRMSGFVLLELADGGDRAYSESLDRGHFIDEPEQVESWAADYDRIRAAALSEAQSAHMIRRIMRGLGSHVPPGRPVAQEQLLGRQRRQLHRGGPRLAPQRPRP